ncbi:MAG TPA: hypothetical protein K8V47_09425 [Candidatus Amulumruptor caecigallinarius]|uniref:Uncharacterized protein n=1 Tax=Candidatus Amulumruptor caecigallinarius TaxID=2109911 RepID=A0A921EAM3_9BACT|nr:hypothetical protein [Candidatus Amulumruptor caecigallinarius]
MPRVGDAPSCKAGAKGRTWLRRNKPWLCRAIGRHMWRPYNITESRGSHDPRLLLFGADIALLPFKGRYRFLEKA